MSLILTDTAVQRQVLLERFKAAEVRKFTTVLRQIDEEIRRQLAGGRLTDFRRSRLETQLASMKRILQGQYREYVDLLNADMRTMAVDAARFERAAFTAFAPTSVSIAVPAPQQLWTAVTATPLSMTGPTGGALLESFISQWVDGDAEMVTNAIRMGYALGETNDQIIARIRGSAQLNFADGVLAKSRSHAETVTRTAIQHVANSARAQVWEANSDIIDEYQIVATLDSRTTPLCRSLDGQRYPVGKGPVPPFHPNCRTTTVAVIKGDFGRYLEEESTRASVDGPVPANETYYDWLKRQDPEFQDIALGPTRGQLFRDGGLSVEQFAKLQLGKNFEPMTLEQMRKIKPKAFKRAGL
jgi:SPP1 gp7 family putative phage head morphogenesis protein